MAEPDLLELFRKHAQDGQKEMVSLFCNDVRRLSRTKKIKRLLVLGRYAGNSELCGHVLRVLEMRNSSMVALRAFLSAICSVTASSLDLASL